MGNDFEFVSLFVEKDAWYGVPNGHLVRMLDRAPSVRMCQ